jgi:hypothetical protein
MVDEEQPDKKSKDSKLMMIEIRMSVPDGDREHKR